MAAHVTPITLQPGVLDVLMLFGYKILGTNPGTYAGRKLTMYQVGRKDTAEGLPISATVALVIDSLDPAEIVLWAIHQYEAFGEVSWEEAPYVEEWRRLGDE